METPSELLRNYLNLIDNSKKSTTEKYNELSLIESDNERLDSKRQMVTRELHQLLVFLKNNKLEESKLDKFLSIISLGEKTLNEVDGVNPTNPAMGAATIPTTGQPVKPGLALGAANVPDPKSIQAQIDALKKQKLDSQKQFDDQLKALNDQLIQARQVRPV